MHYTLKHLRYIEAAERQGSITAAAEVLAVSASSISAAIDGIESQIGQAIFERQPSRGVVATRFGRQFIDEMRHLLAAQARFDRRLKEIDRDVDGTVKLACFAPMGPILLPTILTEVQDRYPNLVIEILEGTLDEVIHAVESDTADFAIGYDGIVTIASHFIPLFRAYPHAALPATHPLATGRFVTLEQLAEEPMVVLDHEPSRRYFLRLFKARELRPNIVYSARTTDTMRALIAAGLAYGIFNIRPLVKQSYGRGDLVRLPLAGEHFAPNAGILYRAQAQITPVGDAIISTLRAQAASGVFDRIVVSPYDPRNS